MASIVRGYFPNTHCINFVHDGNNLEFLERALMRTRKSVVVVDSDVYNVYHPSCKGFVITARYRDVRNWFVKNKQGNYVIRSHTRFLIVSDESHEFNNSLVLDVIQSQNLQILVGQVVQEKRALRKNHFIVAGKTEDVRMRFVSFPGQALVASYHNKTEYAIDTTWLAHSDIPAYHKDNFTVSVFHCPPFVVLNSQGQVIKGFEYQLLKAISYDWPLQFRVHLGFDSWNSCLNDLENGTSDVAACSQWLFSVSHRPGLEATKPYSQLCTTFLVHKPRLLPFTTFIWRPLSIVFWYLTITTALALTVILHLLELPRSELIKQWLSVHGIMTLGTIRKARGLHVVSKMILCILCVTSVLFNSSYSAGYTSILTKPAFGQRISTLKQLSEAKLTWLSRSPFVFKSFVNSHNKYIRSMNQRAQLELNVDNLNTFMQSGGYSAFTKVAGATFLTEVDYLSEETRSQLAVLDECMEQPIVFGLPANSPYALFLNRRILRYNEVGLLIHFVRELNRATGKGKENYFEVRPNKVDGQGEKIAASVQLEGVWQCLTFGLTLASLTLLGELSYFQWRLRGRRLKCIAML